MSIVNVTGFETTTSALLVRSQASLHPCKSFTSLLISPCRLLPDSFEVLRMASDMKRGGELPPSLSLIAAENPLLDPASRLERKVTV